MNQKEGTQASKDKHQELDKAKVWCELLRSSIVEEK
jgi:hypothetical protein